MNTTRLRLGLLVVLSLLTVPAAAQDIPAPVGHVNDFANVIPAESRARMEDLARRVRVATSGDIAVVTLSDIGDRAPSDVALQIGRQWQLGADSAIGSRYRNVGVVILLVPKETSSTGRGQCRIEVGQGAEGFITDAMSGSICRAATPLFQQQQYGAALEQITTEVAGRFAAEFNVALDGVTPRPVRAPRSQPGGSSFLITLVVIFAIMMLMSRVGGRRRGCVGCIPIPIGPPIITGGWHSNRGGWSGGGFGGGFGGGGFGGGGFGGFGGGGGFSGGGGGSSW